MTTFSDAQIKRGLAGLLVQDRVLVKEGEYIAPNRYKYDDLPKDSYLCLKTKKGRHLWQVGRDYCVQVAPRKGGLGFCDCGKLFTITEKRCHAGWKPLWAVLKSIKQEKLLDISEEDARKSGFKDRAGFLWNFYSLNYKIIPNQKEICKKHGLELYTDDIEKFWKLVGWNPLVWVREYEIKKRVD